MNEDERELVQLTESWKNEIKQLAVDYEKAIHKLDKIRNDYQINIWVTLSRNSSWITVIVTLTGLFLFTKFAHFKTISFLDITISK